MALVNGMRPNLHQRYLFLSNQTLHGPLCSQIKAPQHKQLLTSHSPRLDWDSRLGDTKTMS